MLERDGPGSIADLPAPPEPVHVALESDLQATDLGQRSADVPVEQEREL
jgi:hypothetical protein